MTEFLAFRWAPTGETARALGLAVAYLLVMVTMLNLESSSHPIVPGLVITGMYLLMLLVVLGFVIRQKRFAALGLTTSRWQWAVIAGFVVGAVGLSGTATCFPAHEFTVPAGPAFLALVVAGVALGLIEVLVIYGYLQFRFEEAFGPLPAVIVSSLTWTLAHGAALAVPGAGTFATACVGARAFLLSIFVSFFVLGLVVYVTHNIWAAFIQNAVMGNVATSLYMFNLAPDKVFIAKPEVLPGALLLTFAIAGGLAVCQRRGAV